MGFFNLNNGFEKFNEFKEKIKSYRQSNNSLEKNPNIGCIVLTNPIFFDESDWIITPPNWSNSIVQGKSYDTSEYIGSTYWRIIELLLKKYSYDLTGDEINDSIPKYGHYETKVRIGQGAFRVLVTDAYSRRCAISGERTLPVLEAAHIKPYSISGINTINNGLLLRSDLHKLFDTGYITVNENLEVEISRKIKEEFENGRDYYKYHGQYLITLPSYSVEYPKKEFLRWHNESIFRG